VGIIISLVVLSIIIFLHELGHFIAARMMGVSVEVFSIGFGKKVFSKKYNNTEYRLSAIPLGGYVKMKGQDDISPTLRDNSNDSYTSKSPLQRIFILGAGPFANFLTAFACYLIVALHGVPTISNSVGKVVKNSPAFKAGIKKGDKIVAIEGKSIKTWQELSNIIKNSNKPIHLTIMRQKIRKDCLITPKVQKSKNIFGETIYKPMIGIGASNKLITIHYTFTQAIKKALDDTKNASLLIIKGIEKLLTGAVSTNNIGGVITIVDITAKASKAGIIALLLFVAMISVNLGILNLLPIPALDGGHIIFNTYELFAKKPPSEKVLYYLTIGGWVILASLMFLGLYNDINRLIAS